MKNNWDFCQGVNNPSICSVFPADETPNENFDLVCGQEISWVSNIDPSHKPGRHWVSILRTVENVSSTSSDDEREICKKITYYVADSWGYKEVSKTCEHIIGTLENNFTMANFNHSTHMLTSRLRCKCQFEINFPVLKRIQHETFENCGWYAIRFCVMNKEQLMSWANSDFNDYGQIKSNFINLVNYFTQIFFPKILNPPCVDYTDYKIKILNVLPRCKCNQVCCKRKLACF